MEHWPPEARSGPHMGIYREMLNTDRETQLSR